MITNNKNPRFSYMRRVVVLPLMAVVVLLFAFRMKQENANENKNLLNNLSGYTEMFQSPTGKGVSQAEMDEYEAILKTVITTKQAKDGKKYTSFNTSKKDEIKRAYEISQAMTAAQKETATKVSFLKVPPSKRNPPSVAIYEKWKNENEYGVWIDDKHVANTELNNYKASDFALYDESNLRGAAKTGKKYNVQVGLYTEKYFKTSIRKDTMILITKGLSILQDSSKVVITNKDSILKYDIGSDWSNYNAKSTTLKVIPLTNSTFLNGNPPLILVDGKKITHDEMSKINKNTIESINVLKDAIAVNKYGDEGKNGVILIKLKPFTRMLYVIDGKIMPKDFDWDKINLNDIASMAVLKDKQATDKYGDDGKNGVIEIKMKPLYVVDGKIMPKDFSIAKLDALTIESMNVYKNDKKSEAYGDAGKYGVVEVITKPKFQNIPGVEKQEVVVIGYSNITTKSNDQDNNIDKPRIVFTETQIHPEFVGGDLEWQKYLMQNLNRDIPVQLKAPQGKYTVKVSFIVYDNGKVFDVVAENNPGYGTAEEAVRVVRSSPDWKPAMQNGHKVACKTLQSITFVVAGK